MKQTEILIKSSLDSTMQPSLFYKSESKEKRPLLVGLHTWSYDRFNQIEFMLPYAEKHDFHLLLPEFRGPNLPTNPNCTYACASDFAKQDIKDAVDYIVAECENIDAENIFLLGASGGGHMALMMAGFIPEYFRAIGAYVGITDLKKWAQQCDFHRPHVIACCSDDDEEMKKRSPMSYIDTIAKANIRICHGKYDKVVPVSHSHELYYRIIEKHPDARVFFDIFDGGHEMDMEDAMRWIVSQYNKTTKAEVTG